MLNQGNSSDGTGSSRPRPRIETLSDLIFGLALSLCAYSLLTKPPTKFVELVSDILAFGFSFVILILVWMRYTSIMSVLPLENRTVVILNTVMLFLISLEPYLFNLVTLFGHPTEVTVVSDASVFYALDMAALMAILGFFTNELAVEERRLVAPQLLGAVRRARNAMFIAAVLFLLTIFPQFWTWRIQEVPLRFYLWLVPIIVFFSGRILSRTEASKTLEK